jgi:organic radical activating enzyme
MPIFGNFRKIFTPVQPLTAGTLQMQAAPQDAPPYRLHLRMHSDGSGILIVNASTVLHLNPTATEYAHHFIKGDSVEDAAAAISKRYRVNKNQARGDYADFTERVQALISTPDLDPVTMLDFERVRPYETSLSAPLRLDCALTYRLPLGANVTAAPTKRVTRELSTEEWMTVLDKAWAFGIPHITFTGGEPTLREDLPAFIARAEANGQVTGLMTDGLKLSNADYFNTLLQTGLDHLLFILATENPASWQALDACLKADIFVTVHLTITESDQAKIKSTLERLNGMGVKNLSVTTDPTHRDAVLKNRELVANLGMRMVWDLPVPYSENNPVAFELLEDETTPSGAGKAWLYVEPDGDVLPTQGQADQILGNVLKNEWGEIYK